MSSAASDWLRQPSTERLRRRLLAAVVLALAAASAAAPLYAHDAGLAIVRYNSDGTVDPSFGHSGLVAERSPQGGLAPEAVVVLADGRIVLAGTASDLATTTVGFGLARYTVAGSLDPEFGTSGRVLTRIGAATAEAHALAMQADGRLVVAGSAFADADGQGQFAVLRVRPDGSPDPGFGNNGVALTPIGSGGAEARAVALQADDRILVAGAAFASDEVALARYMSNGTLDPTFGRQGIVLSSFADRVGALLVQPDGNIVVAGSKGGHQGALALARFHPNGDLDSGFGVAGTVITHLQASAQTYTAALQPDGAIVLAGGLGSGEAVVFLVARYGPSGNLDARFGTAGIVTTSFDRGSTGVHGLHIESDGKLMAVGAGNGAFAAARYQPDGAQDGIVLTTVSDAGSTPAAVAVQGDGKVVATGPTYFLVPTPTSNQPSLAWLLLAIPLILVVFRMRRRRTGPAPAPSRPRPPAA